jgi:beta-galactosidase/beta-glucuronidase
LGWIIYQGQSPLPKWLDKADEMGLLYYEEPGSFHSGTHDPFIRTILREKVFRMIKRDRSHPSLIIYNMINEFGGRLSKDKELVAKRFEDMRDAHAIDPSRTITFTSGWANKKDALEDSKASDRPTVIIANTIKGKGVSFMENACGWHGKAPSDEDCQRAMEELK